MEKMFEIQDGVLTRYLGSEAEVIIPDGVVEIGKDAFVGNGKLVSVKMPDSVVKIGVTAFDKCTKLKTVEFSRKLERIEYEAFSRCKALKEVELPDTLQYMGEGVFAGCEKLQKVVCESRVYASDSNPFGSYDKKTPAAMADKDGFVIFMNVLCQYLGAADVRELIIPEGVTRIRAGVFKSGTYSWETQYAFEKVILPSSVNYVGNYAFCNCKNIKTIEMPQEITFGQMVFEGCAGLADENGLIIHNGVLLAYCGNGSTVTISEGTKVIAPEVFACGFMKNPGNQNIQKVVFPESLEQIGAGAFKNCDLLEQIEIPKNTRVIGTEAFAGCDHLRQVVLPDTVEDMGEDVFTGCKQLADENGLAIINGVLYGFSGNERHVVVPEGVVEISNGSFRKMGVVSVELPKSLKKLGSAFTDCEMLEQITIPEGVEEVSRSCFSGCTRLSKVELPSTLRHLRYDAFLGCKMLETVKLPAGLETIGESCFGGCGALKEIHIPDGVKVISNSAFRNCIGLERVTLSEGLERIRGDAFSGCSSLKEITIPASVTTIEYSAFMQCTALSKLHCSKVAEELDPTAFQGCDALADENGFIIICDLLWKYNGPGGDVAVPEGVRRIMPNAFREGNNKNYRRLVTYRPTGSLKSLTLPSTLREIGEFALAGCTGLKQLTIPAGVEVIKAYAFYESGLEYVAIPETVTRLSEGTFCGCAVLQQVELPQSLQHIEKEAFLGCKALKTICVHAAVKEIGDDAFRDCEQLVSFEVSQGNQDFAAYDGMLTNKAGDTLLICPGGKLQTAYEIPDCFHTIGRHAFINCKALRKIVIPASVQSIGDEAFPRRDWQNICGLKEIVAAPGAGGGVMGEDVFSIQGYGAEPQFYPQLPPTMVREQATQILLAIAYCQNPEKYEGEYAKQYEAFAKSHEKSIIKKAESLKLPKVAKYFSVKDAGSGKKSIQYNKLSEQGKVEMLEQAVVENNLEKAKAVIAGCKKFEFTARALGLACVYSSLEMVKLLVENGATFDYVYAPPMKRKYGAAYGTKYNVYPVRYSKLIARSKMDVYNPILFTTLHEFHFGSLPKFDAAENSDEVRGEIAQYLLTAESARFDAREAMSYAIIWGRPVLAQRLKELGVKLTPPIENGLTESAASAERNECMLCLSALDGEECIFALKTLSALLEEHGKKLVLTQKAFEEEKTALLSPEAIEIIFSSTDTSKLTKSKLLEMVIAKEDVQAIAAMVRVGAIQTPAQRDKAIRYAMDNQKTQALAWLMDYKNKTADLVAEAEKAEKKAMRELTEDPNSVSAMKKKWGYKKLEDGTLCISSYKGDETHVEVPAMIGKAKVTAIGDEAFSASNLTRCNNRDVRKMIESITIPEGVTTIGERAFWECKALTKLALPQSLQTIGQGAFRRCPGLLDEAGFLIIDDVLYYFVSSQKTYEDVTIPEGVKRIATGAMRAYWTSDPNANIRRLILPQSLEQIDESAFEKLLKLESICIPAGVKTIGERAFAECGFKTAELSEGLEHIGALAFYRTELTELRLPESLRSIGRQALYGCGKLRDLYIPGGIDQIGEELLGDYGEIDSREWGKFKPSGLYVYTPENSAAAQYMDKYPGVYVTNQKTEG